MQTIAVIGVSLLLVVVLALMVPGRKSEPAAETDNDRYAAEIAVAADRAAVTAARHRAAWEQAQRDVDDAWAAYRDADAAARRIDAACPFPTLSRRRRAGENADRERYLHRAATAACRRHELSIKQLNEALAHRGWNPRLHPIAQEAALHRAMRTHRFAQYQAATARERAAWEAAEIAATALACLRAEARSQVVVTTAEQTWWAEQWDETVPIPAAGVVIGIRSSVDGRHPIAA
jgi:hypothetical protein